MSNIGGNYGNGIIELLKDQGIDINEKLTNTINLLASDIFEKGKAEGKKEGKRTGINQACKEFEIKIGLLRSKNMIE